MIIKIVKLHTHFKTYMIFHIIPEVQLYDNHHLTHYPLMTPYGDTYSGQ